MPPKKKIGLKKTSFSKRNKQSRIKKYELGATSHTGSVSQLDLSDARAAQLGGIVTYVLPIEVFATGIRNLDQ